MSGASPHQPPAAPADNKLLWFVGFGLVALLVVMVVASQRYDDPEIPQTGQATPEEIATGQEALTIVGCYAGEIDGKYGPQTDQAIRDFQAAAGLAVDGIFGPETLAALKQAAATGQTVCTTDGTTDGSTDGSTEGGTDGGTDEGGDGGEGTDTRSATLESPGYGSVTFTISSWDCTGDAGDLVMVGQADDGRTLNVLVDDSAGTLAVEGGSDDQNVNGDVDTVSKEPGAFASSGAFTEPNLVGEEFTLAGTC